MDKIVNSKYLKKGNHLVLLYKSASEMTSVISKYIIESLKNNEEPDVENLRREYNRLMDEMSKIKQQ